MLAGPLFELLYDLLFDLSHNQLWHNASILSSAINDSTHRRREEERIGWNPAFDGSTPLQVIERGETDRIWRMVYELESGEPA
jgi:hypothetical protein